MIKISSLFSLMVLLCSLSFAQSVQFEQGLGWEQVLQKARQQNKYVFVDVYATWCIPCKKMDKEVFDKSVVGKYMNANFVSIKVQMDTSRIDDENIKNWYKDAYEMKEQYKVGSYPTYLFFSPNGNIVHRSLSVMPDSLFLKVASDALKPEKQYYTQLANFQSGRKDFSNLFYLASISRQIGETHLADKIASDYLENFLDKQTDQELLQKKHFEFASIFRHLLSSKNRIFWVLYNMPVNADNIMQQKGFSKSLIYTVITREEIEPGIWPNNQPVTRTPDWNKLAKTIGKKYNSYYTGLVVVDAQLKWYKQKKDKQQQIKYTVKKIDNYGLDTAGIGWAMINNVAYSLIFKFCSNKDTLNKAVGWMEVVLKSHPEDYISMDTYANLLYKAGRKEEAIQWEEKAVALETSAAQKEKRTINPEFQEALEKMKKGIPTWN